MVITPLFHLSPACPQASPQRRISPLVCLEHRANLSPPWRNMAEFQFRVPDIHLVHMPCSQSKNPHLFSVLWGIQYTGLPFPRGTRKGKGSSGRPDWTQGLIAVIEIESHGLGHQVVVEMIEAARKVRLSWQKLDFRLCGLFFRRAITHTALPGSPCLITHTFLIRLQNCPSLDTKLHEPPSVAMSTYARGHGPEHSVLLSRKWPQRTCEGGALECFLLGNGLGNDQQPKISGTGKALIFIYLLSFLLHLRFKKKPKEWLASGRGFHH